jgi:hypothetical protein
VRARETRETRRSLAPLLHVLALTDDGSHVVDRSVAEGAKPREPPAQPVVAVLLAWQTATRARRILGQAWGAGAVAAARFDEVSCVQRTAPCTRSADLTDRRARVTTGAALQERRVGLANAARRERGEFALRLVSPHAERAGGVQPMNLESFLSKN